ncbi:MAG: chemotaxis protein CheX [Planctomycetota bacterium]
MDQSYILPFVKSVQNVFETMLQLPIEVGEPSLKQNPSPQYDVSGIIAMSGDVEGSIVLSFPTAAAERAVGLFTGMEMTADNADFPDAIGELVNMVSGGAKAQFTGKQVSISCPSVVIGANHEVHGAKDLVCIRIPCTCDIGEFNVEVALKQAAVEAAA